MTTGADLRSLDERIAEKLSLGTECDGFIVEDEDDQEVCARHPDNLIWRDGPDQWHHHGEVLPFSTDIALAMGVVVEKMRERGWRLALGDDGKKDVWSACFGTHRPGYYTWETGGGGTVSLAIVRAALAALEQEEQA